MLNHWKIPLNRPRRGAIYVLVLGIALLVTVMGMGTLLTTRLAGREALNGSDWQEAGVLAQAAVEHALSYLNVQVAANPTTWRNGFTSFVHGGAAAFTQAMGRGTWSWEVIDPVDGNFSNNYQDPFRIYGIGIVGQTTRVYSVLVVPGMAPLDILRCGIHSNSNLTTSGSICLGNGPVSTNGNLTTNAAIYGNAECLTQSGSSSNVTGTLTTSAAIKTMPSAGVYNLYLAKAVAVPWSAFSGMMANNLLTPTNNPWGPTNADGVYSITVPAGSNLNLSSLRIVGTLLISMTNGTLNITGPIAWNPNRTDYPMLIVNGSNVSITIQGSNTWLSESTVGMDLNGNGTATDDIPPYYTGLIHIIGSSNSVTITGNTFINGLLVADCPITTNNQNAFISDPNLYAAPPIGYGTGQLRIVPGSWLWDSPP